MYTSIYHYYLSHYIILGCHTCWWVCNIHSHTLPYVSVYIHALMLNNQSTLTSLSLSDLMILAMHSTNSYLYITLWVYNTSVNVSYFVFTLSLFMLRLRWPNNYSTGFNHGEYYALNITLHLSLLHVSSTYECLCITALSMKTITLLRYVAMLDLTLCKVWYTKLSKSVESTAPSMT